MVDHERRSFLYSSCGLVVACSAMYPAESHANPLLMFLARSLLRGGARSLSRSSVRSAIRTGSSRAGKRVRFSNSMTLKAELTMGLSLSVAADDVPVWEDGNDRNTVEVTLSANVGTSIVAPFSISVVDHDTGAKDTTRGFLVSLAEPSNRFQIPGFGNVRAGRKKLVVTPGNPALEIAIQSEEFVLVV